MTAGREPDVPDVRDVLGVPALPPGRATETINRVRTALARAHRALAPPPVRIVESALAVLDQAVLVVLCRTDVPDRLTKRAPIAALATDLGVDADALGRLLRYAHARGWVRLDRRGRVAPTRALRFLRRDHPGGWRAWVEFTGGDDVTRAIGALEHAVRDGRDPFAVANGASFFDWAVANVDRGRAFDAAMAAGGRMHGLVLASALDWSSDRRVCDVGGGTGELLATLLAVHPHLDGVLLDLPTVVARARSAPRLQAVAGDAFRAVPPDCDTYLFVNVLHDWSDDDACRLLRVVRNALGPAGRVVVVEQERRAVPIDDIGTRTDLLMLALTPGGRERTTAAFARLAGAADLRLDTSVTLASGDRAYVLRP